MGVSSANDGAGPLPGRGFLLLLLRLVIGVGLLVYLIESGVIDLGALSKLTSAWPISLAAIGILVLDVALMAWRLCILLRPLGVRFPFGTSLRLTLISSFFAMFLPGKAGGDLVRVFYAAKENGGRRTEIVSVLLFDRALGLFSLLILPLLFLPLSGGLLQNPTVRALILLSALLALGMFATLLLCLFVPSLLNRLIPGLLRRRLGTAVRFSKTLSAYIRQPQLLGAALLIAIMDNMMVIGVVALAVLLVAPASLTMRLSVVVPMGEIANSLPLTPGGLGVGEGAFDALFKIVGLRGGAEALLCWRIWNAIVGTLGLIAYLRGFRGRVFEVSSPASERGSEQPVFETNG